MAEAMPPLPPPKLDRHKGTQARVAWLGGKGVRAWSLSWPEIDERFDDRRRLLGLSRPEVRALFVIMGRALSLGHSDSSASRKGRLSEHEAWAAKAGMARQDMWEKDDCGWWVGLAVNRYASLGPVRTRLLFGYTVLFATHRELRDGGWMSPTGMEALEATFERQERALVWKHARRALAGFRSIMETGHAFGMLVHVGRLGTEWPGVLAMAAADDADNYTAEVPEPAWPTLRALADIEVAGALGAPGLYGSHGHVADVSSEAAWVEAALEALRPLVRSVVARR